ncbi:MAG TPA: hypothetical protein VIM55_05330 [Mucilaginibacter sp.]
MKKILLITFLLTPFLGFSQTNKPIEGFLGIKFGSSKADVITALKARGGVLSTKSTDKAVYFSNVKLGTRVSEQLTIFFDDNKMYQGSFYFKPEHDDDVIGDYKALVSDVSEIYGKGKSTADFKPPYKNGDGDEVQAIKAGDANFFTDFKSGNNLLQITIISTKDYDLFVIASYYDNDLLSQAQGKEKEKAKADY